MIEAICIIADTSACVGAGVCLACILLDIVHCYAGAQLLQLLQDSFEYPMLQQESAHSGPHPTTTLDTSMWTIPCTRHFIVSQIQLMICTGRKRCMRNRFAVLLVSFPPRWYPTLSFVLGLGAGL